MKLALDTNAYVAFCKGEQHAVEVTRAASAIVLPIVVLAELRAGFACGTRAAANERTLVMFLNAPRVSTLGPDDETSHHYARLFRQLRIQGTPIPTNDLWIASLVSQHDLQLLTYDRHFRHLPQLATL